MFSVWVLAICHKSCFIVSIFIHSSFLCNLCLLTGSGYAALQVSQSATDEPSPFTKVKSTKLWHDMTQFTALVHQLSLSLLPKIEKHFIRLHFKKIDSSTPRLEHQATNEISIRNNNNLWYFPGPQQSP